MKLKTLAAGVLMATAIPLAMAAENAGPYIGANFGHTAINTGTVGQKLVNDLVAAGFTSASMTMEQGNTGFKLLGGYQVNENFAVEGYYADLGKYNFTLLTTGPVVSGSGNIKATAYGVDLLGIIPFNQGVSGIGRIGVYRGEGKGSFSALGVAVNSTSTGTDFKLGLGAEWKLSPALRLRTEWEYYNDKDVPINMLSVGIVTHF